MPSESLRKHVSQLTKEEHDFLWQQLISVGEDWGTSYHVRKRLSERGANMDEVITTLFNGSLIEYHLRNNRSRVLIRGKERYNGYVLCVVFEPKTKTVVTAYWNQWNDNHKTIDMTPYYEGLDVMKTWEKALKLP